jgi:hypothetical protein
VTRLARRRAAKLVTPTRDRHRVVMQVLRQCWLSAQFAELALLRRVVWQRNATVWLIWVDCWEVSGAYRAVVLKARRQGSRSGPQPAGASFAVKTAPTTPWARRPKETALGWCARLEDGLFWCGRECAVGWPV